jgi:hypothetical protein
VARVSHVGRVAASVRGFSSSGFGVGITKGTKRGAGVGALTYPFRGASTDDSGVCALRLVEISSLRSGASPESGSAFAVGASDSRVPCIAESTSDVSEAPDFGAR